MSLQAAEHVHRAASFLARAKTAGALQLNEDVKSSSASSSFRAVHSSQSRRATNRLESVRQSLNEAADLIEAADEDGCINVTLRQYEAALQRRVRVDAQADREEKCIQELRAAIVELEREAAREDRRSLQRSQGLAAATSIDTRCAVIEQRMPILQADQDEMSALRESISLELSESIARNMGIQVKIKSLEQAIRDEKIADAAAMAQLGVTGDMDMYKMQKQRERTTAEEALKEARERCQRETQKLEEAWAEQRAQCKADLEQLQSECEELEAKCEQRKVEVEGTLDDFTSQQAARVADVERQAESEMKRLTEMQQQKAQSLQSETQRNQLRIAESAKGSQHIMEDNLNDLRDDFRARYRLLKSRTEREIEHERKTAQRVKEIARKWVKQAERLRRNCVGADAQGARIMDAQVRLSLV